MKRLGVAISLYNKVDELITNVNVIRKHWKNKDVFISVCCNNPAHFELIRSLPIDHFTPGIDYKQGQFEQPKAWKRMRQYDTIKKAVLGCVNHTEYVVQWHADAYGLDDDVIFQMLDIMDRNDTKVAFRGKWKGNDVGAKKRPAGHVDDHFVIFNSRHVRDSSLYNDDEQLTEIAQAAGQWSSEGILSYIIQRATPPGQLWHYDDMGLNEVDEKYCPQDDDPRDPFYEDGIWHSSMPPFNFDPVRKFLHSDRIEHIRRYFKHCGVSEELIQCSEEKPALLEKSPTYLKEWLGS